MKNHIPTYEAFLNESINEAEKFKATKDFEEFLEEIDGMPEVRIKRIMGSKYIDTPGGYRDEADDYDNDIVEYMISNMGRKEFEKLKAYWETNIKESVNEARMKTTYKHSDVVLFSIDDDKLDQILNDKFARNLDFEDIKGDSYYSLPRREFDRFIDLADSSGFDVDYEGSEDSVIDVIEK
jgi:hypothetical protein